MLIGAHWCSVGAQVHGRHSGNQWAHNFHSDKLEHSSNPYVQVYLYCKYGSYIDECLFILYNSYIMGLLNCMRSLDASDLDIYFGIP